MAARQWGILFVVLVLGAGFTYTLVSIQQTTELSNNIDEKTVVDGIGQSPAAATQTIEDRRARLPEVETPEDVVPTLDTELPTVFREDPTSSERRIEWESVHLVVVHVKCLNSGISGPIVENDPKFCITPPPFGNQCNVHEEDAMLSCLRLRRATPLPCVALTCPARADYEQYRTHPDSRGLRGPICQARGNTVINDPGHLMCANGGCCNILMPSTDMSAVLSAAPSESTLASAHHAHLSVHDEEKSRIAQALRVSRTEEESSGSSQLKLEPPTSTAMFILYPVLSADPWFKGFTASLAANGFVHVTEITDSQGDKRNLVYTHEWVEP